MHLFSAQFPQLLDAGHHGGAAHDAVVNDTNALAIDHFAHRIDLNPHTKTAHALRRLDKGAPHIVVADHGMLIGQAGALGKTKSRVNARIRERHHIIHFRR